MSDKLEVCIDVAKRMDFKLGAKCVRGAYMITERQLAQQRVC